MFSRGNQEKQTDSPLVDELRIDEIDNSGQELSPEKEVKELEEVEEEQPITVKLVEKISGILSPYFIVIVGLYRCSNFCIISIGITMLQ